MAILDAALGLVPMYTPRESQTLKLPIKSGVTVYPGMVVSQVNDSLAVHVAGTGGVALGVCLDYGVGIAALTVEATVCIDPNMQYRCLGEAAYVVANFGQYTEMISNGGSTSTLKATGVLDTSAATDTYGATFIFKIMGGYDVVTPTASANFWFLVKFNPALLVFGTDVTAPA